MFSSLIARTFLLSAAFALAAFRPAPYLPGNVGFAALPVLPTDVEARIVYDRIRGERPSPEVFRAGYAGYHRLRAGGRLDNPRYLTLIDFRLPSTEPRLWVIDLEEKWVHFRTWASHGEHSGELYATRFSNRPSSHQSSLGFYVAAETYEGKHGYSMRLDGVETGINDKARERAIVFHGADYAGPEHIAEHGRLGRSHGCPAVPRDLCAPIVDRIHGGSCLFIYRQDPDYLADSPLLVRPS